MKSGKKNTFISYPYAVACVRTMEQTLIREQEFKELVEIKQITECINRLKTFGFGEGTNFTKEEELLSYEQEHTLTMLSRCVSDLSYFSVFFLPNQFHNLKAAIKSLNSRIFQGPIYYEGIFDEKESIIAGISDKAFDQLPDYMRLTAQKAYEVYLHSGDGMLTDTIIDRGLLEAMKQMGQKIEEKVLKDYVFAYLSLANLKMSLRFVRLNVTPSFLEQALVEGGGLSKTRLIKAILAGEQELFSYIENTALKDGLTAYYNSPAAFECWCDKELYRVVAGERGNFFSIGPLVAFFVARENEIKSVRFLLTGIKNQLSKEWILERMRLAYE